MKKLVTPRDPNFVAMTQRKQGAHQKTTKALRRSAKVKLMKDSE